MLHFHQKIIILQPGLFKILKFNSFILFFCSSSDKTVKIWDIQTKECVHTFNNHKDQVWGVKFSPNGSNIVSVSEDKSICIYNCV